MLDELGSDSIAFVSMDARDVAYSIRAMKRRDEMTQAQFNEQVDKLAVAVRRWQHEIRNLIGIGSAYVRR